MAWVVDRNCSNQKHCTQWTWNQCPLEKFCLCFRGKLGKRIARLDIEGSSLVERVCRKAERKKSNGA